MSLDGDALLLGRDSIALKSLLLVTKKMKTSSFDYYTFL